MLYKQLSYEERVKIEILLNENLSIRGIAKRLSRNPSTISRELKRNYWDAFVARYNFNCADRKYHQRQKIPKQPEKMKNTKIKEYVEKNLEIGWSPEQISGRIKIDLPGSSISYETIYKHAYKTGKKLDLKGIREEIQNKVARLLSLIELALMKDLLT